MESIEISGLNHSVNPARNRLALIVLSILMLGAISPLSGAWALDLDPSVETDVTFLVYPDGDFEVNVVGTLEQGYDLEEMMMPLREILFSFQGEPVGTDLHDESGSVIFKLEPQYALFLSTLDLDIDVHVEPLGSETTILVSVPGVVDLEMSVETTSMEGTFEGSIDVEATATIWYTIFPRENIEMMLQGFPALKAEIESQLLEYSDGNLEFSELTIVESELGDISATITARMTLEGDFATGIAAATETYAPEYLDSPAEFAFPLEGWPMMTMRSGEVHIYYNNEDLAFIIDYSVQMEGDINQQFNSMKDAALEELLEESDLDPDEEQLITGFLLPTEVGISNLGVSFNVTLDAESFTTEFEIDGLVLSPPSPEALLSFLQGVSGELSEEDITITLEGASQGDDYVEIVIPEGTTEPLSQEPRKATWTISELENMDEVSFETKETPSSSSPSSSSTPQGWLLPAAGVLVIGAAALWFFMSKRG